MLHSNKVNSVGIYTAGMNGQLPNLDLVNTAVRSFRQHQITAILDRSDAESASEHNEKSYVASAIDLIDKFCEKHAPEEYKQRVRNYLTNLKGMLHFMTSLASGPSGPHANFISYNIDSITLSLTKSMASNDRSLSTREVLRSIEMVVRALSNLEEKLHQSFFLYVLPSTSTFVSVGEYYYTVALAISPAVAHMLYLANNTSGMRVAFALTVFVVVEVLCALLLVIVCGYFSSPAALLESHSQSNALATRWWTLAVTISVVQALVVLIVLPTLRSVVRFSGCVEIYDWRKKVAAYDAEQQTKLIQEKGGSETALSEPSNKIPELDSGWRAVKFITMAILVYAHCILGILNYPMALFCAIPMAHFARVVPYSTSPMVKNIWSGLWLFMSSPLVLLMILNWSHLGMITVPIPASFLRHLTDELCLIIIVDLVHVLSSVVDSFTHHINLLALPYICCIYISVHTLSLIIWTFPVSSAATKKWKQE
ncbi:unnamed protein product [Phytophthora fragariaefolia]|uniref:Unnamed protein product n=1 Tax=Phytophthora fragariaefolia TaxID=1490495 RepID=A0A9W7CTA5_9STRA|nr:unnamed protein product [Phytophthora fragariaefolia]